MQKGAPKAKDLEVGMRVFVPSGVGRNSGSQHRILTITRLSAWSVIYKTVRQDGEPTRPGTMMVQSWNFLASGSYLLDPDEGWNEALATIKQEFTVVAHVGAVGKDYNAQRLPSPHTPSNDLQDSLVASILEGIWEDLKGVQGDLKAIKTLLEIDEEHKRALLAVDNTEKSLTRGKPYGVMRPNNA